MAADIPDRIECIVWYCSGCDTKNLTLASAKKLVCKKCGHWAVWDEKKKDWSPMKRKEVEDA